MDKDFNEIIDHIFKLEGFISDDENDRGGLTKYGISMLFVKSNKNELQSKGFLKPNENLSSFIRNLDIEAAKRIYYEFFYIKSKAYKIDDFFIKAYHLDNSINMGIRGANKLLQKTIKNYNKNIVIDGIIGKITLGELKKYYGDVDFYLSFIKERVKKYVDITKNRPQNMKFLKGWVNRSFYWQFIIKDKCDTI